QQIAHAALEGEPFAVGRELEVALVGITLGEGALLFGDEVVLVDVVVAGAVGDVDDAAAVGRPVQVKLELAGVGEAQARAAGVGAHGKHLATGDEGDFLAVGRNRHGVHGIEAAMLDARPRGHALKVDGNRGGTAGPKVETPDAEAALEDDGAAVGGDGGEEDAAAGEMRDRARRGAGGHLPDVFGTVAVGHKVEVAAVGRPHRPNLLGAAIHDLAVGHGGGVQIPDGGLVDVRLALAPPLRERHFAAGHEGHGAVGRGGGVVLALVPFRGDDHGRAADGADAVDVVHAADVVAAGAEVDPPTIGRPGVESVHAVVVGEAEEASG